jgi:hypothetical protein
MQYLPDPKVIYNRLKQSARKRDIEFTLTLSDIIHLDLPITCPIFSIPLVYNRGKAMDNSFSVDRIDPNRGYIADNIWVISWKANRMKSNATLDELKLLGNLTI